MRSLLPRLPALVLQQMGAAAFQAAERRRALIAVVGLLFLPLLANWQAVSGWLQHDPLYTRSALARDVVPGPISGFTSRDPNDGWTTEALGRRAAEDWLRGRVPWWNPYSGPGLPLAAEMQGAALFLPFVLLLHAAQGPLLLKLAMQVVAGLPPTPCSAASPWGRSRRSWAARSTS